MKTRRLTVTAISAASLLIAAAATAFYLSNRREVTTSSSAAYAAYREGLENEQRFYSKDARLDYARALELDPEFAMAILGLARVSDRDQQLSLVQRARGLRGRVTDLERRQIDMDDAMDNGRTDQGESIAKAIHEKYPRDARAATTLAGLALEKGDSQKALQIYAELIAVDPNNATAYNQMGYFYGFRGDYEKATENFEKYRFLAPDQANPYDSLGEIAAYSGRYDEAIQNLNRALAIKPDFYASFDHLGVAYEGKGQWSLAIASYEKAAAEAIEDRARLHYLGKALRVTLITRDRENAHRLIAEMERLPKNDISRAFQFYLDAARDLADGRPADAERILREGKAGFESTLARLNHSATYKPYDSGWNLMMGVALGSQGRDAEAIPIYEQMANPPNPWSDFESRRWVYEGRARLAALLARRGDLDRAEALLAENRKWNPSWAPTHSDEEAVAQARREKVTTAAK